LPVENHFVETAEQISALLGDKNAVSVHIGPASGAKDTMQVHIGAVPAARIAP